jgi:hypothetical protein
MHDGRKEVTAISVISITRAAKELKEDRKLVRGVMIGLGMPVNEVGTAVVISADDLGRLRDAIERSEKTSRSRRRRRRRTAGASIAG